MKVCWPDSPIVVLCRRAGRDSLVEAVGAARRGRRAHSSGRLDSAGVVDEELVHVLDVLQHDHVVPEDEPVAQVALRAVRHLAQLLRHDFAADVRTPLLHAANLAHRHFDLAQNLSTKNSNFSSLAKLQKNKTLKIELKQ